MNFVMRLDDRQIEAVLDFYRHNVKISQQNHIKATISDETLKLTIYKSGKCVFQGKDAESAFFFWSENFNIPVEENGDKKPYNDDFYTPSIGSDESGVGDYFGPLTVCAAYLSKDDVEYARELGVQDSKNLSDKQIYEMAPLLMKRFVYSLLVLNNKKYNDLITKGYNANTLKAYLHAQTHKKILMKTKDRPKIIVDQFCSKASYQNYLKAFKDPITPEIFITQAESHYASVAMASIIARYAFLRHFHKMEKEIGVTLVKGASKQVDQVASKLIKAGGMNALNHYAKVHFKTTEKAKALLDSNHPSY